MVFIRWQLLFIMIILPLSSRTSMLSLSSSYQSTLWAFAFEYPLIRLSRFAEFSSLLYSTQVLVPISSLLHEFWFLIHVQGSGLVLLSQLHWFCGGCWKIFISVLIEDYFNQSHFILILVRVKSKMVKVFDFCGLKIRGLL